MNDINQFWNKQNSSLNREKSDIFYKNKASEHRSVLDDNDSRDGILDIGCGAGELLEYLCLLVKIDIGLDYSQAMIKAAQERLEGKFSGCLIQEDIFKYLPSSTQPVWTTTGGINQYLDENQLVSILNIFKSNTKVRSFYLFDCIDPLRYDLLLHSISYRPEHIYTDKFFSILKNYFRRLLLSGGLILNRYSKYTHYLGTPLMGYGQRPAFWIINCALLQLNVEIISSRYYEYRYHVIIKKIK